MRSAHRGEYQQVNTDPKVAGHAGPRVALPTFAVSGNPVWSVAQTGSNVRNRGECYC